MRRWALPLLFIIHPLTCLNQTFPDSLNLSLSECVGSQRGPGARRCVTDRLTDPSRWECRIMQSVWTESSHALHRKQGRRDGRNVDKEVMCEDQFISLGRVGRPRRRLFTCPRDSTSLNNEILSNCIYIQRRSGPGRWHGAWSVGCLIMTGPSGPQLHPHLLFMCLMWKKKLELSAAWTDGRRDGGEVLAVVLSGVSVWF